MTKKGRSTISWVKATDGGGDDMKGKKRYFQNYRTWERYLRKSKNKDPLKEKKKCFQSNHLTFFL